MTTRLLALLGAGALCVLTDGASAHGGQYRGPQDTVPPSPGSGRPTGPVGPGHPTTGQPARPTAPSPMTGGSGPITGGGHPGSPGARGAGRTGGGIAIEDDASTWDYWWELNKDPFLRLKDAVHTGAVVTGEDEWFLGATRRRTETLRPSRDQVQEEVLPALRRAIDATSQRDIASSCMIAMAKIGENHRDFRLVDVFRPRLARPDQEIRETAALALGIAGRVDHGEFELLQALALDAADGRAAVGGEVDARTRSFAIYGLGLVARDQDKLAIKRAAFETARTVLADERSYGRDVKVAAILTMGMLDIGATNDLERSLRGEVVSCLEQYFDRDLGAGDQLIQAHCPTALAKLVRRDGPEAARLKSRFAGELQREDKKRRGADLARSCVLALGQLASAHDDAKSPDADVSTLLWRTRVDHRDDQTRYFAVLALGQIGGIANRALLLDGLRKARALERSWFALALGVMTRHAQDRLREAGGDDTPDAVVGDALCEMLQSGGEPSLTGALGIALGLCRHRDAAPVLLERLRKAPHLEDQAGYLSLGLALMGDHAAKETLHETIDKSARRPTLLRQAAVALALLGDKSASAQLQQLLADDQGNLATSAAASGALGLIGDRAAIQPLIGMLFDKDRGELTRAFAAVALGGIADRAPLPWFTSIAADMNYRAATETLRNQSSGILDIL